MITKYQIPLIIFLCHNITFVNRFFLYARTERCHHNASVQEPTTSYATSSHQVNIYLLKPNNVNFKSLRCFLNYLAVFTGEYTLIEHTQHNVLQYSYLSS